MAPLTPEAIAKADALLKLHESDSDSTATPISIVGWLHDTNTESSHLTAEIGHPFFFNTTMAHWGHWPSGSSMS